MSDDMTVYKDRIRDLEQRLEQKDREIAKRDQENKDFRLRSKKTKEELEKLTETHDSVLQDRDQWKSKAESSSPELTKTIESLTGRLRAITHKTAFEKKAAGQVRPDALEALWKLSGYEPDGDEVDEAKLGELLEGAKTAHPWAFAGEEAKGAAPPAKATPKTVLSGAVGNGRGAATVPPELSGSLIIKKSETRDLTGTMRRYGQRYTDAVKAGTLVIQDD